MQTAINLYSVRELDDPLVDILDRVAAAGYDGVQFAGGFGEATPDQIATVLADNELEPVPAHIGLNQLESDPAAVVDTYKTVGVDGAVVPILGESHFETRTAAAAAGERLDALGTALDEHGFDLHYHNHAAEFVPVDTTTAFEVFAEASTVGLELDVGWIHTVGMDPAALIERYGDRVDLIHMKDMADGEFREIGEGTVDMANCAAAARSVDAEWLIYEHDQPTDPASSIETGAVFLETLIDGPHV